MLHQGTSGYIFEWIRCCQAITAKWRTVCVCPLTPVLLDTAPGQLYRTTLEVGTIFGKCIGDDPRGVADAWSVLLTHMREQNTCLLKLEPAESYTLPFPSSLCGPPRFENTTFHTSLPCPATVPAACRKATHNIIRVLIECLNKDLSAGLSPAIISVRAGETGGSMAAQDAPLPPPNTWLFLGPAT